MKKLLPFLFLLTGCATLTAESDQPIAVTTTPAGASCNLHNEQGAWAIESTPGTAHVKRSFSPLHISCGNGSLSGHQMVEAKTRGRAYGNILLLGVPALVDAGTGDGYEYEPDSIDLVLQPK